MTETEHNGCPHDCGACDAMVAAATAALRAEAARTGGPVFWGEPILDDDEARPFYVGAEVEVRVLPITNDRVEWERATITGGPHPHPGGDSVTWDVDAVGGYRFEDEMRPATALEGL